MANEDEESNFAPVYKKYAEMQDAILAGVDKVHSRLERLNRAVGAEWIQPSRGKGGPSKWKQVYDYLKSKVRPQQFKMKPVYSEDELKERKGLRDELGRLEEYNPKDSKGPGILDRLAPYADKMFGKKPEKGKLSDYVELKDTLTEDERKKGLEELEKGQGMYLGEKLEKYDPKDSKGGYGIKAKLNDKLRDAIAKAKSNGDKLENYAELEDTQSLKDAILSKMRERNYEIAPYSSGDRIIVGKDTIGLSISRKDANGNKPLRLDKGVIDVEYRVLNETEPVALLESGTHAPRKSYGLEAKKDELLRRRKINEMDQYAPEHSGR